MPVDKVREGTLEHEQYRVVRGSLPQYARLARVIADHTGARKSTILKIRREWVDHKKNQIKLAFRSTDNKRPPRYLPIFGDMTAVLDMWLTKIKNSDCPFLILIQDQNQPVFEFEKAWDTACDLAGVPDALSHDLRRTALMNMIEASLSENEAMEISRHKTRAVFDLYHIVSERRMNQSAQKLEAHLKAKETQNAVTDSKRGSIEVLSNHGESGGAPTRDHRIRRAEWPYR
jgi:integrase